MTTLLRNRAYWRWSAAAQAGRLPGAMAPLAFTVLMSATAGSFRLGAAMMTAFVVGELVAAVPAGRLLDAVGPARGVRVLLLASAAVLVVVGLATPAGVSPWVSIGLMVVCGVTAGGVSGALRSMLARALTVGQLPRATSVDAMVLEGVIVGGPVLVAVLSKVGPVAPVFAMAAAYALSAVIVRGDAAPRDRVPRAVALPWAGAAAWLGCGFAIGHLLSTIEVAPLVLAARIGGGELVAAVLIGVLTTASIGGSLLFAWRGRPGVRTAIGCLLGLGAGGTLVAFDLGRPGLVAGLVIVGACTGPLFSTASVQLQRVLPDQRRAEGFSVAYVVQSAGFGLGSFSLAVLPLTVALLLGAASAVAVAGTLAIRARCPSATAPR